MPSWDGDIYVQSQHWEVWGRQVVSSAWATYQDHAMKQGQQKYILTKTIQYLFNNWITILMSSTVVDSAYNFWNYLADC